MNKLEEVFHWLDGFLTDKTRDLSPEETQLIKDKINSCFNKVTPNLTVTSTNETYCNIFNEPWGSAVQNKPFGHMRLESVTC